MLLFRLVCAHVPSFVSGSCERFNRLSEALFQDSKRTAHLGLAGLPSTLKKVVGGVIEVCEEEE